MALSNFTFKGIARGRDGRNGNGFIGRGRIQSKITVDKFAGTRNVGKKELFQLPKRTITDGHAARSGLTGINGNGRSGFGS